MSAAGEAGERFWITKARTTGTWLVIPPNGFGDDRTQVRPTFAEAIVAFVELAEQQCPMCLKGAVEDTDWGWECQSCGSSDVAVGCTR